VFQLRKATRRICQRNAPGERPYIVVMTANALKEDHEKCLAAGMNDYLYKRSAPTN
jgi:CheY-like chemotaxis protein